MALIAQTLRLYLPDDYSASVRILSRILGPENLKETGSFNQGYWLMPVARFAEDFGLETPELSLDFIEEITKRNTGEYAVRPYLRHHTELTIDRCHTWSLSSNFHVRRLSSECMRPRLPWATRLEIFISDPAPVVSVISNLKDDPVRYVQKSVANALNDILKDNYKTGIEVLSDWARKPTLQRSWIIKHALRNQIKRRRPEALAIRERLESASR